MRWGSFVGPAIPWVIALDVMLGSVIAHRYYLKERKAVAVAAAHMLRENAIGRYERPGQSCCGMMGDWPPPVTAPDAPDDGCWAHQFCAGKLEVTLRDVDPDAVIDVKTARGNTCHVLWPHEPGSSGARPLDPDLTVTYESSLEEPTFYDFVEQSFTVSARLPVLGGTLVATSGGKTVPQPPGYASEAVPADVDVEMEWALW